MAFINLDFIWTLGIVNILILLIVSSFTNGIILFPASQIILIFGGLLVGFKNVNFFFVFALLVLSNFLGNYLLYFISFKWGEDAARKILPMRKKTLDNHILILNYLFRKYGSSIIFIGRNIPIIHSLVSVPAGIAKVSKKTYTIYTLIGICTWTLIFMGVGMFFGNNYAYFVERINFYGSIITLASIGVVYYFFNVYMGKVLILAKADSLKIYNK